MFFVVEDFFIWGGFWLLDFVCYWRSFMVFVIFLMDFGEFVVWMVSLWDFENFNIFNCLFKVKMVCWYLVRVVVVIFFFCLCIIFMGFIKYK